MKFHSYKHLLAWGKKMPSIFAASEISYLQGIPFDARINFKVVLLQTFTRFLNISRKLSKIGKLAQLKQFLRCKSTIKYVIYSTIEV